MKENELTGVAQQPSENVSGLGAVLDAQQRMMQEALNLLQIHTATLRELLETDKLQQKEIEQLEARLGNLERRV
ncbi:hypothetical protein LCGC14_1255860 [marine sediment metagenome]|uniref:Uncharacterized protein n=1 Tax=marine sediment metagenome TaxID=412755 RepID=A0A0F9NIR6_9ZZZZ